MEFDLVSFLVSPVVGDAMVSGAVGYASGFALKKLVKVGVVLFGFVVLLLEFLQAQGVIQVDYGGLSVFAQNILSGLGGVQGLLVGASVSVGAGFAAGFSLGIYKG